MHTSRYYTHQWIPAVVWQAPKCVLLTVTASGFIGLAIHLILHKQPWSEHTQHRTDVAHNHLQSTTSSFSVTKLAQQTAFQEVLARPSLLLSPPAGDQGQT